MYPKGEKALDHKKKKVTVVYYGLVISVVLTVLIGLGLYRIANRNFENRANVESFQYYCAMITDDTKSSFWQSVYEGAYEKGLSENVYVELFGENLDAEYSKQDLLKIAIASKVDGIIVTADESDEMTKLINEAVEKGIPVVTLFGDDTRSNRCSFVGIGSYNLGLEYGKKVLEIAGKNAMQQRKEPMQVAVLVNSYAKDYGQNILCSGIQEIVDTRSEGKIKVNLVAIDDTNAFSVEESIRDMFMEEQLPDVIICLNERNTNCTYQAVVDYNKVGEVHILGYYDSDMILHGIERGVVEATVAVDTKQMGDFCIQALTEYHELGYTSQYLTADVKVIDKNNVKQYLEKND